jgi:hypothetical protein
MNTLKRVKSFVHQVAGRASLDDSDTQFATDLVVGMCTSKSVLLSEIARVLDGDKPEDEPLIRTEQRLSKGLLRRTALDKVMPAFHEVVAPVACELPFVTVDGTDHTHLYGRAFEFIDWVSDRSVPGKPVKPGYLGVLIEATDGEHRHLPLYFNLFSTQDPDYQTLGEKAWQAQFQGPIQMVLPHTNPKAWWLFDRGFDDTYHLLFFRKHLPLHVVRMCRSRNVQVGSPDDPATWNIGELADGLNTPYAVAVPYVDKKSHRQRQHGLSFTFIPVRIPGIDEPYGLIVVRGGRAEDWLLLCSRVPKNAKEAADIIRAYTVRWGSEEVTRCHKQSTGAEKVRVRGFDAMKRLLWLSMMAVALQAMWLFTNPRFARRIMRRVRAFIAEVLFPHYRLWDGTAIALRNGT